MVVLQNDLSTIMLQNDKLSNASGNTKCYLGQKYSQQLTYTKLRYFARNIVVNKAPQ